MTMSWGSSRMGLRMGMVLLASLALAACGGGGGGSSSGSGSTTPPPTVSYTLSVSVSGNGSVSSSPAGISCGSSCSASFNSGTQVTLTATAASGYTFSGWGGACSDSSTCTITMNQAQSVSANFTASAPSSYTLSVSVSGNGSVSSSPAGINCGSTCSASFNSGTQVTLTATPASGATFSGWGGACAGTSTTCTVTMSQAQSVTAGFSSSNTAAVCPSMPPVVDPSTGVTGTGLVNYTALPKPAVGVPFTDPDFGNTGIKIIRITDVEKQFNAAVAMPAYPTVQAWNCNETRLILYVTQPNSGGDQGWAMFDGNTYQFIKFLPINPSDIEQFWWSRTDPSKLYYIDNHSEGSTNYSQLTAINVETNATTVVHNFIPDLQKLGWPTTGPVRAGYPFMNGNGNQIWGLGAGGIPNVNGQLGLNVFGFNMATGQLIQYPGEAQAQARGTTPAPLLSGKGWFWNDIDPNNDANNQTWVLDSNGNVVLKVPFSANEHVDTDLNAAGQDVLLGVQYDTAITGNLIMANLQTGAVTTIIGSSNGYGYPRTGSFTGATAWRNPAWVVGATIGDIYGTNQNGPVSNPQTLLDQEIFVANINTGQVYRIAHNRSTGNWSNATMSNYWAQPNVTISPSGTRILFNSDWGDGNPASPVVNPNAAVDTYVIELPGYKQP